MAANIPPSTAPAAFRPRRVPAWLLSLGLHTLLLVVAGLLFQRTTQGLVSQPDREVGIALVRRSDTQRHYEPVSAVQESRSASEAVAAIEAVPSPMAEADLLEDLPDVGVSLVELAGSGLPSAAGGGRPQRAAAMASGAATTTVFGITATGSQFVYAFDRSGSMAGFQGRPLAAAKGQLLQSLLDLEPTHQFQVIFYNERPEVFRPSPGTPRMVFANGQNVRRARQFVRSIQARGGTEHMAALRLALSMRPDVVFFLTDADEPRLTTSQLAKVRRMNGSTTIHTIEFGFGPQRRSDNFLVQLAEQNGGRHVYVDVARIGR